MKENSHECQVSQPKKAATELIILDRLNRLPKGSLIQKSPIEQDEAQAWAAFYGAEKVYYWPGTKSAFIVKEVVAQPAKA
jgi:hypothetical protein